LHSLKAGIVSVTYTIKIANCTSSATRIVRVALDPALITFTGEFLYVSEAGAEYQWIDCANGNTPIAGETGETFTPATNGSYAVIVYKSGCIDTSDCTTVTGLNIAGATPMAGIRIYPNPASDILSINTGSLPVDQILIRDITGKVLRRILPTGPTTTIDISGMATGIYLLEVMSGHERYTSKVSIVR